MDRIIIKPSSKEIVLRSKPEDGHVDVFSYNYEDSSANGLGGLFIVGQVHPANEETSYLVNLVASLAKREYYSLTDSTPKEAFSKTLKKINEVLQDFFRNKELKVNIGLFAIAGENILISRLGKFKIILARDNQSIDVLNNINLFNKEHIQEKEFSNIVSGKIMSKDKILAFYAGRSMVAREKNIYDYFIKLGADEFSEKLNSIKLANDNFLCAAIHVTINKLKEPAIVRGQQPQELLKPETPFEKPTISNQPILAKISKASKEKISLEKLSTIKQTEIEPKTIPLSETETPTQPPIIRPTEFSSAKKENFISTLINGAFLNKFKPDGMYVMGIGQGRTIPKKRLLLAGSLVVTMIMAAIISKLTFAPYLPIPGIENATTKAANALIREINNKLESARSLKDQNNFLEARRLLSESLFTLAPATEEDSEKTEKARQEVTSLLDEMDKAVEISPSLFQEISQNLEDDFQVWSFAWSLAKGELNIQKPDIAGMMSWYPYQDNLYVLASDGLFKITDAAKGKNNPVKWLNQDVLLPPQSALIAVDSKIYVLTQGGSLVTYYKGSKESEVSTSIPVSSSSVLLTNAESSSLYLIDKELGRIYVLTKSSGSLEKTIKLNNNQPLLSASMSDTGVIYLLTKDNKVWNIIP